MGKSRLASPKKTAQRPDRAMRKHGSPLIFRGRPNLMMTGGLIVKLVVEAARASVEMALSFST